MSDDAEAIRSAVTALAEPVVAVAEVELVEVDVKGQRNRRVVRVVVDREDGVGVDAIAQISRGLSEALDADEELIVGAYTLEVTSPGVDRPLTEPRHFRRNVGRAVKVVHEKDGKQREVEGKLTEADDDEITVNVKGRMVTIPLDSVERAKVVLPW